VKYLMDLIEKREMKEGGQDFRPGDNVKVHQRIFEGEKERIQIFEGVVIRIKNAANRTMVTVRKVSYGVGVEKIFPIHAPTVERVEVISKGKARRAKLYYLRNLFGKAARVEQEGANA